MSAVKSDGKAELLAVERRLPRTGTRVVGDEVGPAIPEPSRHRSASPASAGQHAEKALHGSTGGPASPLRESHAPGPAPITQNAETATGARRESEGAGSDDAPVMRGRAMGPRFGGARWMGRRQARLSRWEPKRAENARVPSLELCRMVKADLGFEEVSRILQG